MSGRKSSPFVCIFPQKLQILAISRVRNEDESNELIQYNLLCTQEIHPQTGSSIAGRRYSPWRCRSFNREWGHSEIGSLHGIPLNLSFASKFDFFEQRNPANRPLNGTKDNV